MFDIGFWEILIIGVVALLVIGPEKLPEVAATVGRWVGKIQRFVSGVKSDFHAELESGDLRKLLGDQEKQINELKEMVNTARKDFEGSATESMSSMRETIDEARDAVKSPSTSAGAPAEQLSQQSSDNSK